MFRNLKNDMYPQTLKQNKPEQINIETNPSKTAERQRQREDLKTNQKGKRLLSKEWKLRLTNDFSRQQWKTEYSKITSSPCWEKNTYEPRILYPVKISFKNEEGIQTFLGKEKLRGFVISGSSLKGILKNIIPAKAN